MNFKSLHCGVHHIHFDDVTGIIPIAIVTIFMCALAAYAIKRYIDNTRQ